MRAGPPRLARDKGGALAFVPRKEDKEAWRRRVGMDAEDLLRHRVRGIIVAAEGRAEHLLEQAGRDAADARREAALEALEAVAEAERELTVALHRLSQVAERLAGSLGDRPAPEPRRHQGRAFIRASMRERPVAELFAAAGEEEALSR